MALVSWRHIDWKRRLIIYGFNDLKEDRMGRKALLRVVISTAMGLSEIVAGGLPRSLFT